MYDMNTDINININCANIGLVFVLFFYIINIVVLYVCLFLIRWIRCVIYG